VNDRPDVATSTEGRDLGSAKGQTPQARWISEPQAAALLHRYGIAYPDHEFANDVAQAVAAATRIGYPVVMKVVSEQIVHKSDVGGVIVGLANERALRRGFRTLHERMRANAPATVLDGVLIASQAPAGLELIIGGHRDAMFGPVVAAGLGGTLVEVLGDVALRLAPLTARDARAMIDETKLANLLAGSRGSPALDRSAVEQLLLAVSDLLVAESDVIELDLNPVRAYETRCLALDVRLGVASTLGSTAAPAGRGGGPACRTS